MSDEFTTRSPTAQRLADRLRADGPWDLYAEEARRYEVHLRGTQVELVRGPLAVEGYSVRVLRPRAGKIGSGAQASTDLSDAGVLSAVAEAESIARHSEFPAESIDLPGPPAQPAPPVPIQDPSLWNDPREAVERYLAAVRDGFSGRHGVEVSFGSVRTTRVRTSVANSAGFRGSYLHTLVEVELAIKSSGGPEGAPPGEYWVNSSGRRLETAALPKEIDSWCRYAADVRRSQAPPSGELTVVLPCSVLSGILPSVLGFKASGAARLRKLALEPGAPIAAEALSIADDGGFPWSPNSAPFDAEGTTARKTPIVEGGTARGLLYDSLHAAAFHERSTGNAVRVAFGPRPWLGFVHGVGASTTTLSVAPGTGGTEEELCESAGEGIWVQQLGWANPDPLSGAFGGEIRIGYRIRQGKLAEPVRGGVVGGFALAPPKAPSLLANVAAVGSRVELQDNLASPGLVVKPLTVAGSTGGRSA